MNLTAVTWSDFDYAGAVGGGTFSGFGSMARERAFGGSLNLELTDIDPIEVRSGPAVLFPQGDMIYEGPFVDPDLGAATLRLQLHEVPRTFCPGRLLEGTWTISDDRGSVGGTAFSSIGPDFEPLGMCEGISIEGGPIELALLGDPAAGTGDYVGFTTGGSFKGIGIDNGVWDGNVEMAYLPPA